MHYLNVVVSRTDTIVGKVIRQLLNSEYNHCSIYLDDDLSKIYSFSRRFKQLWFTGCFTTESLDLYSSYTTFTIEISEDEYVSILDYLIGLQDRLRIYNYPSALLVNLGVVVASDESMICSTFVAKILSFLADFDFEKSIYLYTPSDIYLLLSNNKRVVVRG